MTAKSPSSVAQSVWTRLVNRAKDRGEDPNYVLMRYAAERLLYRLSISAHSARFVLKGAMLFAAWTDQPHRATKDVDLLGYGDPEQLVGIFREVCALEVEPDDALRFKPDRVRAERIRDEEQYDGRRVLLEGLLGHIPFNVQVDIGFGDAVTPAPVELVYPALLESMPSARLKTYPPETVIAEKFEAMVKLGIANSRMKDFYDVWVLSNLYPYTFGTLRLAAKETFTRRGTSWPPADPIALSDDFSRDTAKQTQWRGFLRRTRPVHQPELGEVVARLAAFLGKLRDETETVAQAAWDPTEGAWAGP